MTKPENICDSDYGTLSNKNKYARSYFKRMFLDIWYQLKDNDIKVREIKLDKSL